MDKLHFILIAGARPNFMKIAPLMKAFTQYPKIKQTLIHTGQHYDTKLSRVFFEELGIPAPHVNLEVGSGLHGIQTGKIMIAFEETLEKMKKPSLVIVVGDVNSTLACALVAAKRGIPVAHVEAGLRSFDQSMPEEINRVLTDAIADFLFCTEPDAMKNLKAEGINPRKIFFVGNVLIDTMLREKSRAEESKILQEFGLKENTYALLTLHRASNVDNPKNLRSLMNTMQKISAHLPVIFPVHPRTKKNLARLNIPTKRLVICQPLGYLDFLKLMSHARFVLTDSGGIQEETTILKIPCLTLRKNTERPITLMEGTNQLVGMNQPNILHAVSKLLTHPQKKRKPPKKWDGKAAQRIANILFYRGSRRPLQTGKAGFGASPSRELCSL